jgi:hypothetical protein
VQRNIKCCSFSFLASNGVLKFNISYFFVVWERESRWASLCCEVRPVAQTVYVAVYCVEVYGLEWHATAAPNPRQQVCRHFILMSRQQWIMEGRLVAALVCRSSCHMQPTCKSNDTAPHMLCTHTQTPHKFSLILLLIYYTYIYIYIYILWREGFCFVKSRQVYRVSQEERT